jgi:hypothetical protein
MGPAKWCRRLVGVRRIKPGTPQCKSDLRHNAAIRAGGVVHDRTENRALHP